MPGSSKNSARTTVCTLSQSPTGNRSSSHLLSTTFTIGHIIQCELQISTCHTGVGDEESPDEVVHLPSTMRFATGLRSMIGTMWAVDDGETNKITSVCCVNMPRDGSGRLDHSTRAAFRAEQDNDSSGEYTI
ncbi:hypothetical protein J3R83DRAFT_13905 [Lanmaoa asiatica]|nr:hypothetical protein J3R83DRAFT_13905 [Lanmaoa asiatica]